MADPYWGDANKCSMKCLGKISEKALEMLDGYSCENVQTEEDMRTRNKMDAFISACVSLTIADMMDRLTSIGNMRAIIGKLDPGASFPGSYSAECPFCQAPVHNSRGVFDKKCIHLVGWEIANDIFIFANWRRR